MNTTMNVLGTIIAIVANLAVLIGFPAYVIRARRDSYPARHRAAELESTMVRVVPIDTPELHAARTVTEQHATRIERRAAEWNAGPLARYEHGAGSPVYLDITPGALARERRSDGFERERVWTTGEMYALFGVPVGALGPIELDEWAEQPEPVPVGAP